MASYSLTTNNAAQDAALARAAQKARAATVDQWVRDQFARIVQKALEDYGRDLSQRLPAAFLSATPAKQARIVADLGLDG
jgi:hypothetical protein